MLAGMIMLWFPFELSYIFINFSWECPPNYLKVSWRPISRWRLAEPLKLPWRWPVLECHVSEITIRSNHHSCIGKLFSGAHPLFIFSQQLDSHQWRCKISFHYLLAWLRILLPRNFATLKHQRTVLYIRL